MNELADRIEALIREEKVLPRLHPNGFFTLDLSETEKLHVWPDEPVRTRTDQGFVHDHAFGFRSVVLAGCLLDTRFDVHPSQGGGSLYRIPCRNGRTHAADQEATRSEDRFTATAVARQKVKAGLSYLVPAGMFHRSDPIGFTATYLTIIDFGEAAHAHVLVPYGLELGRFDRTLLANERARASFAIGRVCHLLRSG